METLKTFSAGGVVVGPKGHVLVVNQDGTSWSLPKGRIEAGEDERTAAERETEEESGIKSLNFVKKLGTYSRYKIGEDGNEDKSEKKTITLFLFTTDEESLQPIDPENPEARWVDLDEVGDLLSHPADKAFYGSVLEIVKDFISKG